MAFSRAGGARSSNRVLFSALFTPSAHDRRMSVRAFKIALALIAALVLLSATAFPGAMIGFMCAIAIAFFLAPLTFAIAAIGDAVGRPIALTSIVVALIALYGMAVLFAAQRAWSLQRSGDLAAARLVTAKVALFAALPLVAWLSSQALKQAWP
ncbi:MAG TPA: hypothetical protein VIL65_11975 [Beijerinckiaceae bacterium]|jgi:hypothetical protein